MNSFRLSTSIFIVILFCVSLSSCDNYGSNLKFNNGDVYYKEGVEKVLVEKLGKYLQSSGYFDGKEKSVQLIKEGKDYTVRFVVIEGADKDQKYLDIFKSFSPLLSYDVFSEGIVNIEMCDIKFKTLHRFPGFNYGKRLLLGNDILYFKESVNEELANKLGKELQAETFFQNKGLSVQLLKSNDTYQLKYPIKTGMEKDQDYINIVKQFISQLSPRVFDGKPLEIHLCNDFFETLRVVILL